MTEPDHPLALPAQHWSETALALPSEQVAQYVAATRRAHPDAGPAELIDILTGTYRRIVTGSGGAFGAASAGRRVGPTAALALTAGTLTSFVATSSLYCLAVAQVHGVPVHELQRRRELVRAVLVGRGRGSLFEEKFQLSSPTWASVPRRRVPTAEVRTLTRLVRRRAAAAALGGSALVLSKALPYGLGAAVGGWSAHTMATHMIEAVADVLGPPPVSFAPENFPEGSAAARG